MIEWCAQRFQGWRVLYREPVRLFRVIPRHRAAQVRVRPLPAVQTSGRIQRYPLSDSHTLLHIRDAVKKRVYFKHN